MRSTAAVGPTIRSTSRAIENIKFSARSIVCTRPQYGILVVGASVRRQILQKRLLSGHPRAPTHMVHVKGPNLQYAVAKGPGPPCGVRLPKQMGAMPSCGTSPPQWWHLLHSRRKLGLMIIIGIVVSPYEFVRGVARVGNIRLRAN